MSGNMTIADYELAVLEQANFTGGIPSSRDLAPSIVFLIVYALTVPLLVIRLSRKSDRTTILIRPSILVAARIAMLIIRAIQSKQAGFNLGLMIAELVLVSVGFLFLVEPVISLWQRHVAAGLPKSEQPAWVLQLARLLKISLLAAIATAIAGGATTSNAFSSQSGIQTVRALREASYCLSLGVVGISFLAIIGTHFKFGLDARKTLYLLLPATCLLIVGVYRVAQCFSSSPSSPVRSLAAFWVLQVLFEYIAYFSLLAISIPRWFPAEKTSHGESSGDIEMAQNK